MIYGALLLDADCQYLFTRTFVMTFLEKKINFLKEKENSLYALGSLCFIVFFISNLPQSSGDPKIKIVMYLGFIFFFFGSILFIRNSIYKLDKKPIKIVKTIIFNSIVSPLSFSISRNIVSSEIGLPPSDFDLTVLTITPFAHVYVITGILGFISLFYSLYLGLIKPFFKFLRKSYTSMFGIILLIMFLFYSEYLEKFNPLLVGILIMALGLLSLFMDSHAMSATENNANDDDVKNIFRAFAILIASLVIINVFENKLPRAPIIRLLAYYLDYYETPLYPNLKTNKKVQFHANRIVSYASRNGFEVTINIEEYKKK